MKVARVTLSDRASQGVYEDRSGPEIERVLGEQEFPNVTWLRIVMPDDLSSIEQTLRRLVDDEAPTQIQPVLEDTEK